jgi:hypothetical protein
MDQIGVRLPVGPQMIKSRKFQRRIEAFVCDNCGQAVEGNGYTDHCPVCLWGKHVDVNPGDRAASCGGMMEPVGIEVKSGEYTLLYICKECGYKYRIKSASDDNFNTMIRLAKTVLRLKN